jgi:hypothetical protein
MKMVGGVVAKGLFWRMVEDGWEEVCLLVGMEEERRRGEAGWKNPCL